MILPERWCLALCALLTQGAVAAAQPNGENGRLQIHFINVGQGDAALLISPRGQTVLFDNGVLRNCDPPVAYLSGIGIKRLDYHVASHYHADHIGCSVEVFADYPVRQAAFDRGSTYDSDIYRAYERLVRNVRKTARAGQRISLDGGAVTVTFLAVNGEVSGGLPVETNDENDNSVVAVVKYGSFDAVFGGDLSGKKTGNYRDVETRVGQAIGPVEVYKVNHHGSSHSTNAAWLGAITPRVAIISAGVGNSYKHPKPDAMQRLHDANVRTYWTTSGYGAVTPVNGRDVVGDNIVIDVAPNSNTFQVRYSGGSASYPMLGAADDASGTMTYAWSSKSAVYHRAECTFVRSISATNIVRGNEAPDGKRLHDNCPRTGGTP